MVYRSTAFLFWLFLFALFLMINIWNSNRGFSLLLNFLNRLNILLSILSWLKFIFICLFNKLFKAFIQSNIILCWAFEVLDSKLFSEKFSLFFRNFPIIQINFISDQNSWSFCVCMLLNRIHPSFYIFECTLVSNIKWYYNSISFSVEWICDCSKSFLPCCVPDFNRDLNIVCFCFILFCSKI